MERLDIPTERGSVLTGVLFPAENADTVVIAITGIHGNFYSNPFYYNIGETLNSGGYDFIYAQTNDAFSEIETYNVKTGAAETIGSWNERFSYTDDDISAYLNYAAKRKLSKASCATARAGTCCRFISWAGLSARRIPPTTGCMAS